MARKNTVEYIQSHLRCEVCGQTFVVKVMVGDLYMGTGEIPDHPCLSTALAADDGSQMTLFADVG